MKKLLTLSTGIVFIAILVAACNSSGSKQKGDAEDLETKSEPKALSRETITITLDSIIDVLNLEKVPKKHLLLHDRNHPRGIDTTYITDVRPGDTVRWDIGTDSGIEEIKQIKGVSHNWIFKKAPYIDTSTGKWTLVIPDTVKSCIMEEYKIKYTTRNEDKTIEEYESDPYLRIPE